MRIRKGKPEDYSMVMSRVLLSFCENNPSHLPFDNLHPETRGTDAKKMSQWLLAEEDGEIVAGMRIVPRTLKITSRIKLEISGLGDVFTYPPFRGKGFMRRLLEKSIEEFGNQGHAINILGGDRIRYGRYGWETAGHERKLQLGPRMVRFEEKNEQASDFKRWDGNAGEARKMYEAFQGLECRSCRSFSEHSKALSAPDVRVWISEKGGGFAYAALCRNRILEYAGDIGPFEKLLVFLIRRSKFSVSIPPAEVEAPLEQLLVSHASGFSVCPTGMIRINSLLDVLKAYKQILERRLDGWHGRQVLHITDSDETVEVNSSPSGLSIKKYSEKDSKGPSVLEETRPGMARVLFGPFPPFSAKKAMPPFLRLSLPLPLYLGGLDHV